MSTHLLLKFKETLIQFLDELIDQFPKEGDIAIARIFIKDQFPIEVIAKFFITNLLQHKDLVLKKDEKFFLENDVLFSSLRSDKVMYFKKLWLSTQLTNEDKDTIFAWFKTLLEIIDKYNQSLQKQK
jgi:hypothetical protein